MTSARRPGDVTRAESERGGGGEFSSRFDISLLLTTTKPGKEWGCRADMSGNCV